MADQKLIDTLNANAADEVNEKVNYDELTLEALLLLVATDKVGALEEKSRKELKELRQRQAQVTALHKLLKAINAATDSKGNLTMDDDLKEMLSHAAELGVEVDLEKGSYNRDEKDRLVENIRLTCDDLNTQNDMQIQAVSRLTNERYEAYQLARSILKPLHEDKINKARSVAGR